MYVKVKLTIIHDGQKYMLNGPAKLVKFKDGDSDNEFTRVEFLFKTMTELIEWQEPFDWEDECVLKTPDEVYKGLYCTHSRLDGAPIIRIYETRILM